jgi:MOSC domain-containing protein YiiM
MWAITTFFLFSFKRGFAMPFQGHLRAIQLTPSKGAALVSVPQVEAIPGQGLAGDRRATGNPTEPLNQVTLIEVESLVAAARDYELTIEPLQTRRNLLTEGVPLNHLVGVEFQVGPVVLRGIELCEPCGYLEKCTFPGIKKALFHRGGLRAEIVRGGTIHVGDVIQVAQ